jgi:hypothetical protein
MTSVIEPTDQPTPVNELDGAVKEYPRERLYVITAVVLAAITGVEILTYTHEDLVLWSWGGDSNAGVITTLMFLMAVKFFIVAYIFMHLRFDKKILTWAFYTGLALAVAVYLAVMFMFRLFTPDSMVAASLGVF